MASDARAFARLLILSCLLATPAAAEVPFGAVVRGANRSHTVAVGWPEVSWIWEGLLRPKVALGPRIDISYYPLGIALGVHARFLVHQQRKAALAILMQPSARFGAYGGIRGVYPGQGGFGRSVRFRPALAGAFNLGLLGSVEVARFWRVLWSVENPTATWVWLTNPGWYVEWPLLLAAGAEYEAFESVSFWGRLGGGPAFGFTPGGVSVGGHWMVMLGAQFYY